MKLTTNTYPNLGIVWIFFAALCVLEAAWLALNANVLRLMWGVVLQRVPNPYPWLGLFNLVILCGIVLLIATALFAILGAIALMRPRGARPGWAVVAALLGLICGGPVGIALGVYTLILLLPRQSGPIYERYPIAA